MAWLEMRRELWPSEDPELLERDVRAYFENGVHGLEEVLLAEAADGALVGFAELNIRPYAEGCVSNRVAYLEGWFVAPGHRRSGAGAALVHAAERWAAGQGLTELASDALADNEASAAAHRALGFEEVEVVRCFRKRLEGAVEET